MPRTLGIVTIGQAPRDDIANLFAQHAPAGTKVVLRGALDGFSDAEVDALRPENGADTLYTRLRGDQRLRWRNEQFGYPLTAERLAAIRSNIHALRVLVNTTFAAQQTLAWEVLQQRFGSATLRAK